jgi:hypothetical protein
VTQQSEDAVQLVKLEGRTHLLTLNTLQGWGKEGGAWGMKGQ